MRDNIPPFFQLLSFSVFLLGPPRSFFSLNPIVMDEGLSAGFVPLVLFFPHELVWRLSYIYILTPL